MINSGISGLTSTLISIEGDLGVPSHFRFLGVKTGGGGDAEGSGGVTSLSARVGGSGMGGSPSS